MQRPFEEKKIMIFLRLLSPVDKWLVGRESGRWMWLGVGAKRGVEITRPCSKPCSTNPSPYHSWPVTTSSTQQQAYMVLDIEVSTQLTLDASFLTFNRNTTYIYIWYID